ncbi:leucine-rich_repeat domain-containing protein [Hexamita inflata]|uniref:Leucine-rich repeat domain-containing protein n=1 Tax=Hexamita inflata TaxID=28002 RepID=A0AA86PI05_9EUKA|nr:leucine-rich repeat domain-containing protein [Hexamita inflata]
MTQQNEKALNEEYDAKMTLKYAGKIKDGNLEIDNSHDVDPEITNLRFLEKFDIQMLKIRIRIYMHVKLRSNTIKALNLGNQRITIENQLLNLKVDDLELENLEVLELENNKLENDQLYNLAKFKKLNTLNVSNNNVDLTHIHTVSSLTKLTLQECGLKNIKQIASLVNLKELDLSKNTDLDLSQLCKLQSLTKLSIYNCGFKNIDQFVLLTNLEVLVISYNLLKNISSIGKLVQLRELDISWNTNLDIAPLKDLVGLIILNLSGCDLRQLSALKPLINLQTLDLTSNYCINISELQYLKNLTHLYLADCYLVSVYVLRPLVNLEELYISHNKIVYLDANINEMTNLKELHVQGNSISDFTSVEKHSNYNNINNYGFRIFKITSQQKPSYEDLFLANKLRKIESPNIQLKQIYIYCKTFQTALGSLKQQINTMLNSANHIQFTFSIAHLFDKLNQQTVSQ